VPELRAPVARSQALAGLTKALRDRDAERALRCASQVRELPLDRALLLTLLLADQAHPRYPAAARRFLVRFALECETSLIHVKRLADALAHLRHPYLGPYARQGLDDLVVKLRAREHDLWVEFNSLPE
jgi:hypothetical protein